MNKEEKKERRL